MSANRNCTPPGQNPATNLSRACRGVSERPPLAKHWSCDADLWGHICLQRALLSSERSVLSPLPRWPSPDEGFMDFMEYQGAARTSAPTSRSLRLSRGTISNYRAGRSNDSQLAGNGYSWLCSGCMKSHQSNTQSTRHCYNKSSATSPNMDTTLAALSSDVLAIDFV
jgi:hypothetical protein